MTEGADNQAEAFWQVIDWARAESRGNLKRQTELIEERLRGSEPNEILVLQQQFNSVMDNANTWDLMAACYLINGEAFDGTFDCFCGWLVMQGKSFYAATLEDPESLADYPELQLYRAMWGEITELPERVYREKVVSYTGLYRDYTDTKGTSWKEDELKDRYPRLWATYSAGFVVRMGGSLESHR